METIPLEMDDIFDGEDDDIVPSRLPDLDDLDLEPMRDSRFDESNEQGEDGEEPITDNQDLLNKLKSLKGASKHVTKKSYIKLDATRLIGERGIPVLPRIFKNVKLKGKHHESEDLKTIMHHLEHWGHRLFPKMTFSEVLERAERLGAKKEVQTCVKRIRLGIPVLNADIVNNEEEEDVQREGNAGDVLREGNAGDVQQESDSDGDIQRQGNSTTAGFHQLPDDDEIDELLNTQQELDQAASQKDVEKKTESDFTPSQNRSINSGESKMSEETRLKIEINKRLAMERRAARLAQVNGPPPSQSSPLPPQEPTPSNVSDKDTESMLVDEQNHDSQRDVSSGTNITEEENDRSKSEGHI